MRNHVAWAIIAVVTFAGHMVAGLYFEVVYFLAEYVWFVSVAFSVLAIYSGIITATKTEPDKRSPSNINGDTKVFGVTVKDCITEEN